MVLVVLRRVWQDRTVTVFYHEKQFQDFILTHHNGTKYLFCSCFFFFYILTIKLVRNAEILMDSCWFFVEYLWILPNDLFWIDDFVLLSRTYSPSDQQIHPQPLMITDNDISI